MRRLTTRSLRERGTDRDSLRARGLSSAAIGALALIAGCGRFEPPGVETPFRLTHVRPENADGLFLNEELVFYFGGEIEPASVTSASLSIVSEHGVPARGRLEVGLDHVRFVPAPVLASDLSDGGFLPGTRYTVTLAGFPRPDGLRSVRGPLLEKTRTWTFRTVDVAGPRDSLVFEDRFQGRIGKLRLFPSANRETTTIASHDSIHLACDKPLDPSTVLPEAFHLVRQDGQEKQPLPIRVQLVENNPQSAAGPRPAIARTSASPQLWERERRACVIEVTPEEALVGDKTYVLSIDAIAVSTRPLLRDFSGNPVLADVPADGWQIWARALVADRGRSEVREEFDSRSLRSGIALPGYDGAAAWGETGRVTVRLPAAVGSGVDGRVVLPPAEDRTDVQGVSLDLPEDAVSRLRSTPGLVVLRCQGRMSIRGRLSRECPWDPSAEIAKDPTLAPWSRWRVDPQEPPPREADRWTLSDWLEKAREGDWNWTVLIAGGDLSIEGELTSANPVLLVAGGAIRVSGAVRGVQKNVRLPSADGAGPEQEFPMGGVFHPRSSGLSIPNVRPSIPAWVLVDEPKGRNPLVAPLRFAALSTPIPQSGDILRWLPPRVGGGQAGSANPRKDRWSVRYLRELASVPLAAGDLATVDDPLLLVPPGPIQFLIELEVSPGGLWDPPWVDFVHLAWERPAESPRSTTEDR